MPTGMVRDLKIIPSRKENGNVDITTPHGDEMDAVFSGTPAAAAEYLVDNHGLTLQAAQEWIARAREVRGITKGVGYTQVHPAVGLG